MQTFFLRVACFLVIGFAQAQKPTTYSSSDIYESIKKLNFLGTALYIAAHPDDENTRLISYISNEIKARTAYLSITRGDGGQNLIGTELRELLGVIRTQELLEARRIDGGEQFFTTANDFGYSKHPDETLKLWNKEEVLKNVVWTIRNFKPDVIINRFDHRTPGTTHGHHTSSAMLSVEAFDLAGNAKIFEDQLDFVSTWQPKRLFFNTSWWFYGSQEKFEKADKSKMLQVDAGVFYPHKGLSNGEIAALSRSSHSSQGFGSRGSRGTDYEYVEFLKGDFPKNKNNLFDGINTTWSRVEGGEAIASILTDIEKDFNFKNPAFHIPKLVEAYKLIQNLKDDYWSVQKIKEIKSIIAACAGLYLEASAKNASTTHGEEFMVAIEAVNRGGKNIFFKEIIITPNQDRLKVFKKLELNKRLNTEIKAKTRYLQPYTAPYWLLNKGSLGMYTVDDLNMIGKPETPRAVKATFYLVVEGVEIPFQRELVYKYTDPKKGEIYQPFEVLPEATTSIADKVNIFADSKAKIIPVKIKAHKKNVTGTISLKVPEEWKVTPSQVSFTIERQNEEATIPFKITPPASESEGSLEPILEINGASLSYELTEINYDHIPKQSVLIPSVARVVRLNIQTAGTNIAYIAGAGDAIPESLQQIGYNVRIIDPASIEQGSLSDFDAIVVGIRAYNVIESLKYKQKHLLSYVKDGGNLIVQYNTSGRRGIDIENLAPFPLEISRDRVTDENAEVTFLAKNHSLLNFPNTITKDDFKGWVQERGLYFPNKWDAAFTPLLSMNDKGETPKQGSLLVAKYGKGNYIYTGLSFFRELPAGIPGAFKLFANMLSIGKDKVEKKENFKG
ncbi:PIG-L family deacetylase [Ascidiimonas sp. W6]|uniref:PIG-L family deacetylase n=1 Tax=Ascidiimonas meishanensis TaxID=3128903 RepID=UPI0030ED1827